MKASNYSLIQQEILSQVEENEWTASEYIGAPNLVRFVMAVYIANDMTNAVTMDFDNAISLIAFKNGISCIIGEVASRYEDGMPLCVYEDLAADIAYILGCIEAAFVRVEESY